MIYGDNYELPSSTDRLNDAKLDPSELERYSKASPKMMENGFDCYEPTGLKYGTGLQVPLGIPSAAKDQSPPRGPTSRRELGAK